MPHSSTVGNVNVCVGWLLNVRNMKVTCLPDCEVKDSYKMIAIIYIYIYIIIEGFYYFLSGLTLL